MKIDVTVYRRDIVTESNVLGNNGFGFCYLSVGVTRVILTSSIIEIMMTGSRGPYLSGTREQMTNGP